MAELSPKQELFVREYLKDLNATRAAERAKYKQPHVQGPRLLENVRVKGEIVRLQEQRAEKLELDAAWVLRRLKDISDRCMQAEAITDREGNETGEYRFDASGANRATELIGKHLGMFTDKLEVKGHMTFEQLLDEIE